MEIRMQFIQLNSILLIILFSLFGCSGTNYFQPMMDSLTGQYTVNPSLIVNDANDLKNQYLRVTEIIKINKNKFSSDELLELQKIDGVIKLAIDKLNLITNTTNKKVDIQELVDIWKLSTDSYVKGRIIVNKHLSEFDKSTIFLLQAFDEQVTSMGKYVQDLLNHPNDENINQALLLITKISEISLKVIPLLVK